MTRKFTGKHMAMIMVGGFGVVIAVNFYMASLAIGGFGGVVVKNSYVASQKFNGWLEAAREGEALGYSAGLARDEAGHVIVTTQGVPATAMLSAEMRRPLGAPDDTSIGFEQVGTNRFRSTEALAPGRWIARLSIESTEGRWVLEREVP